MYNLFIEFVARPIYRFVVKPILFMWGLIKKFFKYFGKFLWYIMFATTGNAIVLFIILMIVKHRVKVAAHLPNPDEAAWMFGVFSMSLIGSLYICMAFLYNILHWMFSSLMRSEIIEKEPEFIQTIVEKIRWGFCNIKSEVVKSEAERQGDKRRRKEKREGEKAVKMAAKRLKKEEKIKKEAKRRQKLNIIHDRAEILDL